MNFDDPDQRADHRHESEDKDSVILSLPSWIRTQKLFKEPAARTSLAYAMRVRRKHPTDVLVDRLDTV